MEIACIYKRYYIDPNCTNYMQEYVEHKPVKKGNRAYRRRLKRSNRRLIK